MQLQHHTRLVITMTRRVRECRLKLYTKLCRHKYLICTRAPGRFPANLTLEENTTSVWKLSLALLEQKYFRVRFLTQSAGARTSEFRRQWLVTGRVPVRLTRRLPFCPGFVLASCFQLCLLSDTAWPGSGEMNPRARDLPIGVAFGICLINITIKLANANLVLSKDHFHDALHEAMPGKRCDAMLVSAPHLRGKMIVNHCTLTNANIINYFRIWPKCDFVWKY